MQSTRSLRSGRCTRPLSWRGSSSKRNMKIGGTGCPAYRRITLIRLSAIDGVFQPRRRDFQMKKVEIYDTTLRDGAQAEDVSFTLEDKLRIVEQLDNLGIHFIEGGFPGANPKDTKFFQEVKLINLKRSAIVAFGSTRKVSNKAKGDPNIEALLNAETSHVTIVGKSWDFHVTEALGVTLKQNIDMIADSISYLKSKGKFVFFDAEHYFDGFKANPEYALQTLKASVRAGADCLVLCDTNGGSLPEEISRIIKSTRRECKTVMGIHCHNDSDLAVANSIIAAGAGITLIQGTINGLGE